ncbi:hypothetical protein L218DRAFT_947416 [Marasmius fiardii PR-910]|nr:hypothetical protein L218DRAFT_947416 [Marasmius fiardii PR-910]
MGGTTDTQHPTNWACGGWAFGRQELFEFLEALPQEDRTKLGVPSAEGLEKSWDRISYDIFSRWIDAKTPRPNLFVLKGAKISRGRSNVANGDLVGMVYIFTMVLKENPEEDFHFESMEMLDKEVEYRRGVLGNMGLPMDGKTFKTFMSGRDGVEFLPWTSSPHKA